MSTDNTPSNFGHKDYKVSDAELWNLFRAGDESALFELYKRLYIPLVNYGHQVCKDKALAQDTFSDLMISLWDKRAQMNEVTNVKSYLMTALRRQLIADLKAQDKFMPVDEVQDEQVSSYEDILMNIQEQEAVKKHLQAAFSKLSPRQAQFITMRFYEGMSYEEIAEATGVDIKAVYNKVYEGIKILRQQLPAQYRNIPTFLIFFLFIGAAFIA